MQITTAVVFFLFYSITFCIPEHSRIASQYGQRVFGEVLVGEWPHLLHFWGPQGIHCLQP